MKLNLATNKKLGALVASWSREVGPTCPQDCPFGGWNTSSSIPAKHRCYAEKLQHRRPNVAKSWRATQWTPQALAAELLRAERKGMRAVRIHVGGDWLGPDGKVDRPYLAAVLHGFRLARRQGCRILAWYYTHAPALMAHHRRFLARVGVVGYASVHSSEAAHAAERQGFLLAIDLGHEWPKGAPAPVTWPTVFKAPSDHKTYTCPEQRKGADRATCSSCMLCPKGLANVVFLRH